MHNSGRPGSDTGLFRSVFVWGWGRYGVGCMPTLSLEIHMDPRNWVSGVKFPAVVARNSAQMLCRLSNFTEGAIYKIACLDEWNLKLTSKKTKNKQIKQICSNHQLNKNNKFKGTQDKHLKYSYN